MHFQTYVLNHVSKLYVPELPTIKFRDYTQWLSEPRNAVILTLCVASSYLIVRASLALKKDDTSLPDFPGAQGFGGHLSLLKKSQSEGNFARVVNPLKYPAGYFRVSFLKVLLVCDLKALKEVFVSNGGSSSGRPSGYIVHMDGHFRNGIIFATCEPWKTSRRIFLNYLREWGAEKQFELILEETNFLLEAIEESPDQINPSNLIMKAFCNVICTFIFGSRIDYSNPEIETIIECLDMFNQRNPFIPDFLWPFVARFPITSAMKKRKHSIQSIKQFIRSKIDCLLKSGPRNPPDTLVEAYALEIMGKHSGHLSIDSLIAIIHELFLGGTETSSTTIKWFLACMAKHPEVQEKLYQQVQTLVGETKLTPKHLKELDYFQAVQFEVQRFGCIFQFTPPHVITNSITLDSGKVIPKNQVTFGNLHTVMHDDKLWKHPDQFSPENFLDSDGKFVNNEGFLPYGLGPRICVGQTLADLELKIVMCEFIRRFKITSANEIDFEKKVQGLTCSPEAYEYTFVPR